VVAFTVVLFAGVAALVVFWAATVEAADDDAVVCVCTAESTEVVVLLVEVLLTHPATSRTQASIAIVPMSNSFLDIDDVPVHFSAAQFSRLRWLVDHPDPASQSSAGCRVCLIKSTSDYLIMYYSGVSVMERPQRQVQDET
jgi:hypothetical protein